MDTNKKENNEGKTLRRRRSRKKFRRKSRQRPGKAETGWGIKGKREERWRDS